MMSTFLHSVTVVFSYVIFFILCFSEALSFEILDGCNIKTDVTYFLTGIEIIKRPSSV